MIEKELDKAIIAQRIHNERKLKGWTQKELQERVQTYSEKTVRDWEKGNTKIPTEGLIKLAEIFECDINYLIGKYEHRTKEATDICKATGLSEVATNTLQAEAEKIEKINQSSKKHKYYAELKSTMITGFISYFIENGKDIFATLGDYVRLERDLQELKKLPYWKVIEEAFDKVQNVWQGDGKWIPLAPYEKDGTKNYDLLNREELFYEVLEAGLNKYYEDTKVSKQELEFFKDAVIATPEEKEKLFKLMEDTEGLTDEAMCTLQFGYEVYELLKAAQKKKYYRHELSDNFMDLVDKYIDMKGKEGAEDGK